MAVPETLQRYGLSEVVNHLLGRDPPTPFDMLVMGRFLRSSLQSVMRRHALSGEAVLEVEYLPAMRQPTEAEHSEQVNNIPGADLFLGITCTLCTSILLLVKYAMTLAPIKILVVPFILFPCYT